MRTLFNVYRVLAYVVGVLLILITAGIIVQVTTGPGELHRHVDTATTVVATGHGYLYIVYVILAFVIATRSRWPWGFTLLMLAAGLIPVLIFWVERQVERRMHEDHPEVFAPTS